MTNFGCPHCGASDKNIKYKDVDIPKVKKREFNRIPDGAKRVETCRVCGWKSQAVFNNRKWNYKILDPGLFV